MLETIYWENARNNSKQMQDESIVLQLYVLHVLSNQTLRNNPAMSLFKCCIS